MNLSQDTTNDLLHVSFNQDYRCFACGTESGFTIFNSDPLKERFKRDFGGGIGIVEMLFRCNILAIVGGGRNPRYPPNKVMIWDDYQNKCIAELEFRSEVKGLKLRRDRIVVVLEKKVYVYNFADLQLVDQIETSYNPKGLCALSPDANNTVLACPGEKPGHVHVELYDKKVTQVIQAHSNALTQIALNLEGTLLATASDKGTLIRVFNTSTAQQLREFRRGADRAEIYSIAFNPTSSFLCVSSDKSTIHIYAIDKIDGHDQNPQGAPPDQQQQGLLPGDEPSNRQSSFSFMKNVLPGYFGSLWSFAQFRVPESRCICTFGSDKNSVIVVCADGSFFRYVFDPIKGGEAKQAGYVVFLKDDDE
eukprot:TRINITY_DN5842_c0_g1_i1.p1 TRINITY_DN5842_c0_g1~~TRINITY_DN5842_c0_g1_i1.p1  ORF type:complete len:363 (-),score=82.25 TRINITY_DN5842_c0_g1_i1:66-1154(-)